MNDTKRRFPSNSKLVMCQLIPPNLGKIISDSAIKLINTLIYSW